MAKDKKSFILYSDLLSVVKKLVLNDRKNNTNYSGELFLHILEYVNDNDPIPIDFIVDMAFEPIKLSLKRDLMKYESYIEKQKVNGAKGGRPKKTEITQPFLEKPKKADSVNVSDSVSDSVSEIKHISINNSKFIENCLLDVQWLEALCMQNKIKIDVIKLFITTFESHLIAMEEQKKNIKDFKSHFTYWLAKQNLSQFRVKKIGKTNQI